MSLEHGLSGEWWLHTTPFRHFRANNILNPDHYVRVAAEFAATMDEWKSKGATRKNANYDANIVAMDHARASAFEPFFSLTLIDAMYRIMSYPNLGRVDGGLHSSAPGSRTGWIHNDFCSGWFDESANGSTAPLFPDRSACDYFTGKIKRATALPKEYIRIATLIFYLCNDNWRHGEGGETALYSSGRIGPRTRVEFVPPINNSLLLFPCSPHSYHRFITNPRLTRNSIILWIHARVEDVVAEWGHSFHRARSP